LLAKHSTEQGEQWQEEEEHLDVPAEPCEAWCLCDKLHIAGRRLPALAHYFSKQVLKTILLSASLAFGALAPTAVEAGSSCGTASFYGPGFHGNLTASGERFNSQAMTAAHRSLPFGSRVRVTNQSNGRSVVIKINDDGPAYSSRLIDLSEGAFARIASTSQGLARVCISRL
jgi:rare lipoprotein A